MKDYIDNLFPHGIFGYRATYMLIRPWKIFEGLMRETKWAYQRVRRGYDDRVAWSIDYWLNDIMPPILQQLKDANGGIPMFCYESMEHDKNYGYTKEQDDIAVERWHKELDIMIEGFKSAQKINDLEFKSREQYEKDEKELMEKFDAGMTTFHKNYFSLWD